MSDKFISRRDFLKLGALGLADLAFGDRRKTIDKSASILEQERSFSTNDAIYSPFLEDHTHRDSDQSIIKSKPDYLFLEAEVPTWSILDRRTLSDGFGEILSIHMSTPKPFTDEYADVGPMLEPETIEALKECKTDVFIEAVGIPKNLEDLDGVVKAVKASGSLGIIVDTIAKAKKHGFLDVQRVRDVSGVGATIVDLLSNFSDDAFSFLNWIPYRMNSDTPYVTEIRDLFSRLESTISFEHPENVIIYMRNIFMASKMMTISQTNPKNVDNIPKISYRIGASHSAVSDMIKMGREMTVALLGVYSDKILRQIVDYNIVDKKSLEDKIDDFCTIVTIPVVKQIRKDGGYTTWRSVKDEVLSKYLKERLLNLHN